MRNRILLIALAIMIASLSLIGCDRPAPLPPTVATSTGVPPFPVPNNPTVINEIQSQTAVALTPPPVATPLPTNVPGQNPQPTQPPAKTPQSPQTPVPTKPPVVVIQPTNTPRPVIVVPTATPGRPSTYTIQPGDTFYCLARRFNLNVAEFLGLNGLTNNSFAVIGQVVRIPSGGTWSGDGPRALKAHPDVYVVQPNDTLNKIACMYGDVDPNAILYANKLSSAADMLGGMTLNIP